MNKLYILDFIISSIFAGVNINFIKTNEYKVLTGIIWGIFIISSLLLNNNLPLYFISSIIIGFCILAIYIILVIPIRKNIIIIFWILFFISAFIFTGVIISKKMFFANIYNEPLMGIKGDSGTLGIKGESYFLKTYPEKCYNELILAAEDYIIQNMKINDIEYDPYEYQINNLYFKQLLKDICLSRNFNDYVLLGKITNSNKDCSKGTTFDSSDVVPDDDVENRYDTIVAKLKIMVVEWIKYILFNNKNEDNNLKETLGYDASTKIENIISISNNNLREDLRYNNRTGRKFFEDYFLTDKYFDEYLIKKNNERDKTYKPFDKITESHITLNINNVDTEYSPFKW
jgi:hypothetical protein